MLHESHETFVTKLYFIEKQGGQQKSFMNHVFFPQKYHSRGSIFHHLRDEPDVFGI